MKQKRAVFSLSVAGLMTLVSCSSSPSTQQQNLQNSVTQTQQGIQVGLNIYDPNNQPQQSSQNDMTVTVMSPDFSFPLKSPAVIHGKVSGVYFSEGVFPVILADSRGKEIGRVLAHADGEWMTQDVVPFTAEISFNVSGKISAKLIFQKDNPSGLPENDASQSFDVFLE